PHTKTTRKRQVNTEKVQELVRDNVSSKGRVKWDDVTKKYNESAGQNKTKIQLANALKHAINAERKRKEKHADETPRDEATKANPPTAEKTKAADTPDEPQARQPAKRHRAQPEANQEASQEENSQKNEDEEILPEAKAAARIKTVMDKTTKLLESTPIDKWQATYKIPYQKQNKKVIEHIVWDVRERALKNVPDSLDSLLILYHAAQLAYEEVTRKQPTSANGNALVDIFKKDALKREVGLLEKNIQSGPLSELEKKQLKEILEQNGTKNTRREQKLLKFRLKQKLLSLQDKEKQQQSRRDYTKENTMFELNRSAFYRRMNEDKHEESKTKDDEIMCYWKQVWTKAHDEDEEAMQQTLDFPLDVTMPHDIEITEESFGEAL
ncbi:MAG: uncharacterized protein A8A55_3253, partial [Amphiamblys sp. WSBS2006]